MARIRTIKPEFWTDEKVVQLPYQARLLFIGIWNFADDDGYMAEEPERIRLQILPADQIDAESLLDLLVASGLLERLTLEDDKRILFIPGFPKHQKISHKANTKLPVKKAKKVSIPNQLRRDIAIKYGCKPGNTLEAKCYYCDSPGNITWWKLSNGRPSSWVSFSGLEIDHFIPEHSGGETNEQNTVLACRFCNRSKGTKDGIEFLKDHLPNIPEDSGEISPEGKGIEGNRKEGKGIGDSVSDYFFEGKVIKLNLKDYEAWKKAYHAIPDFDAQIKSADDWISGEGEDAKKRWFHVISASLANKHQKYLKDGKTSDEDWLV